MNEVNNRLRKLEEGHQLLHESATRQSQNLLRKAEDTHCNYISESIAILLKDARFVWQLRSCSTSCGQDHRTSEMYLFFLFLFLEWSEEYSSDRNDTIRTVTRRARS